jgi:hypothetical protein
MRALAMILIMTMLLLSCSATGENSVSAVLIDVRKTEESLDYTHHLLLFSRNTGDSAVLLMPGELILGGRSLNIREADGSDHLREEIGELLGLHIDAYLALDDENGAGALFAILDSLAAEQTEAELTGDQRLRLRWEMLYRHAGTLATEQVIENVYTATSEYIENKRVKQFLETSGKVAPERKGAHLIAFPIDMNGKALYDGAYAKELVQEILRELNTKNR